MYQRGVNKGAIRRRKQYITMFNPFHDRPSKSIMAVRPC